MTYQEYLKNRQEEFNKLPVFYAFSDKQLEEELVKRGLTLNDLDKIRKLGHSGFALASDMDVIREYCKRDRDAELRAMMEKNKDFARQAIRYEMNNVEYPINWQGDYDVCSKFGNIEYSDDADGPEYLRQLGFSERIVQIYNEVKQKVRCA